MSRFLCKSLLRRRYYDNALSLRWLSSSSSLVRVSPNKQSFTVSYLINSLGFSLEASKVISKRVTFETGEKPDKAIDFLRNFGFSQTQIPKLVRSFPQILVTNTERTILPKLEFLESKGISRQGLVKSLSTYPTVLGCSLENQIIPTFESLRTLLHSEAKIAKAMERFPNLLTIDFDKYILPNLTVLRSYGVPESNVAELVCDWSQILLHGPVRFRETIEEVAEMGFCPSKVSFLVAVLVKVGKENWKNKVDMYKKWGWSDEDILEAFLNCPRCMCISEDRFSSLMDFFLLKIGLRPCDLAKCPIIFSYNLKKRVIPRVTVFGALVSKGLVKKRVKLYTLLHPMEKVFLQRYVTPYANAAPDLLKLYNDGNEIGNFEWIRDLGEI